MHRHFARWAVITMVGTALLGCKDKGSEGAPATSASAPAAGSGTAAAAASVAINPEVKKRLEGLVAGCTVGETDGDLRDCKNDEAAAFQKWVKEAKPATYHLSLAEIALTEGAKNKKLYAASVRQLGALVDVGGRDWLVQGATKEAAERVIKIIETAPDSFSFYFPPAVAVPLVAGMRDKVTAALQKRPAGQVKNAMYLQYLGYGGADALPDLQSVVKSAAKSDEKHAAVWAVGVAVYPGIFGERQIPPADQITKMCDWAKGYLQDADPQVANGAAASMGRCKGGYIDAANTALAARAEKDFNENMAYALRDLCWSEGVIGGAFNATKEQCSKTMATLEKVTQKKDIAPANLRSALWVVGIAGKGPDQAKKAKQILGKFTSHKDKNVANTAKDGLKSLK